MLANKETQWINCGSSHTKSCLRHRHPCLTTPHLCLLISVIITLLSIHNLTWQRNLYHKCNVRDWRGLIVVAVEQIMTLSGFWQLLDESNSYQNEWDPKIMLVRDFMVKGRLIRLLGITYTNKMHILFCSSLHKNSTVMRVWLWNFLGWVSS